MNTVICTSGTDITGKFKTAPLLTLPKKIYTFTASIKKKQKPKNKPSLLLSAVWNSASWRKLIIFCAPFETLCTVSGKMKSYPKLLQVAFLLCYLREISCTKGMVVLVGGVRRKALSAWSSVGYDRRAGTCTSSKERSAQKGEPEYTNTQEQMLQSLHIWFHLGFVTWLQINY